MKRRLNILALLILLALVIHTGYTLFYSWEEISTSYKEGYERADDFPVQPGKVESKKKLSRHEIYIRKESADKALLDSVRNVKTNSYVPVDVRKIEINIPENDHIGYDIFFSLMGLLLLPAVIAVIVLFLKLIGAIQSTLIFTKTNVLRLRWIGICLLLIGAIYTVCNYVELSYVRSTMEISGYEITHEGMIEFPTFINALIAFLAAEVFAIGLRLREEQELTI